MPDPTSHPWWKRPTIRWVAAVVALRLTAILLFRSRRAAFLDAVRRSRCCAEPNSARR
jgi:hypothetical protein